MTFFTGLRDDTAGPLIDKFGQSATHRVYAAATYNNATGKTVDGTPTDTPIKLLELKGGGPKQAQEWTEDVAKRASAFVLTDAKLFAAAGVTPEAEDTLVYGGKSYKILAIKRTAPSGVPVIYKMAVQNA